MNRYFVYSLLMHFALVLGLFILSFVEPLRPEKKPIMIGFAAPGPIKKGVPNPAPNKPAGGGEIQAPKATPAPPPPAPKATPPPAPKEPVPPKKDVVKKQPKQNKEIVKNTKDIVEKVTPKATPEPTPEEKPAEEKPKDTPTAETTPDKPTESAATPGPAGSPAATPGAGSPAPKVDLPGEPSDGPGGTGTEQGPLGSRNGLVMDGPGGGGGFGDSYAGRALFLIEQNFRPPSYRPGVTCQVSFNILRDGTIDRASVRIKTSSGWPDLDQAALRAVLNTGKLPELYDTFTKAFMEVSVTFQFDRRL